MYYFIIVPTLISFLFVYFVKTYEKTYTKLEHGCIATQEYNGHTYICYTINMGAGIVHDPNCKCQKNKEEKNEYSK